MAKRSWVGGNRIQLLENGEAYFPRVFESIAQARSEVLLETFILYEDKVGRQLHAALLAAARNGVKVDITIDGWGSPDLSEQFISELASAGIRVHIFDPTPGWLFRHASSFRRLHRKLVVVDGARAFVGGINYSADHMVDFGPEAKQDYAIELEGPIVAQIHDFMHSAIADARGRRWFHRRPPAPPAMQQEQAHAGTADALFVWRDNGEHRDDIERQYRLAMRLARKRLTIANAYFFPGYAFLRELRRAARRGVEVTLILQGKPDMAIVQVAASLLYGHLLRAGVRIYEYCERPLHGKVALVDDEWATVGSSNLDPLSLSLNLEANVMIRDRGFNKTLSDHLQHLIRHNCKRIEVEDVKESAAWRLLRGYFLFHFLRRYPAWAGWLPAHVPRLGLAKPARQDANVDRIGEKARS
jgi:cardiolipin synthase A/B